MEYNFKVTDKEANTILNSLAQMPYLTVVDLINKLQKQASEQMNLNNAKPAFYAEMPEGTGNGV